MRKHNQNKDMSLSKSHNRRQDQITPFVVEALDVRGRIVHLGDSITQLLRRQNYPAPVSKLLAQATALAAMLANSVKLEGRLTLQAQTDGPVSLLVVDMLSATQYRATARFDREKILSTANKSAAQIDGLLGHGMLAITIEQGQPITRYQGVVGLDGDTLEEAAQRYFIQSEQIPTQIRLAVSEMTSRNESDTLHHCWQASGLMLQFLPNTAPNTDNWVEAQALLKTLSLNELADPDLLVEQLLYRLFHERGVRVFDPITVQEQCSCNREKVKTMLMGFSAEDLAESVAETGEIEITCKFCNRLYQFDPKQLRIL